MKRTIIAAVLMITSAFSMGMPGSTDLLEIHGFNQVRFTMWGREKSDPSSGFDLYNQMRFDPRITGLFSAHLMFETRYGFFTYDTLTSATYDDDFTFRLRDAFLTMEFAPELVLTGGRFRLPFGYSCYREGSRIPFYGRTMASGDEEFLAFGGYDVGAMLSTDFGPIVINLAYTNGTDSHADTTVKKQFTADIGAVPVPWARLGAAVAIVGQPELEDQDSWSATGLDFYVYGERPVFGRLSAAYTAEYMILPWRGPAVDNMENGSGSDLAITLSGKYTDQIGILSAVEPAVRFEVLTPAYQIQAGASKPEEGRSSLDVCLNLHSGDENVIQIGTRSFGFQQDIDGYTNVYINWRMVF